MDSSKVNKPLVDYYKKTNSLFSNETIYLVESISHLLYNDELTASINEENYVSIIEQVLSKISSISVSVKHDTILELITSNKEVHYLSLQSIYDIYLSYSKLLSNEFIIEYDDMDIYNTAKKVYDLTEKSLNVKRFKGQHTKAPLYSNVH